MVVGSSFSVLVVGLDGIGKGSVCDSGDHDIGVVDRGREKFGVDGRDRKERGLVSDFGGGSGQRFRLAAPDVNILEYATIGEVLCESE